MSQIRVVDASFQFYEHLLSIDLSDNIIEDIEDKSFAAQVPPQPHLPPPSSPYLGEKEAQGGRGSQCPPQISKSPIEKFKRMNKPSKKLQEEVYTCCQVALQQLNLANNRIRHLSDKVTITTS